MSTGGTSTNTVQNSDPWAGAQPYLSDILTQAQKQYNTGQSFAPFSTVAPPSPTTQLATQLTTDRALNGSPVVDAADKFAQNTFAPNVQNTPAYQYLNATANGSQLNSNPYIDSNFKDAASQIGNYINGEFEAGGRGGSGANQDVLERNLNQLANQMYGQNYQNETQLQQNAANTIQNAYATQNQQGVQSLLTAPSLAGQDYTDLQNLFAAGNVQDTNAQNQLNDLLARYQFGQQEPSNLLSNYASIAQGFGGLGKNTTGSTQQNQSLLPSLIGGSMGIGSNLLSMLAL